MTDVRYARAGNVHIAWAERGAGPVDLVFCGGYLSQVEHMLRPEGAGPLFDELSRFGRVLIFDRRGSGLSDRVVAAPTLEEQMHDVFAVLDAAGSARAVFMGSTGGAPLAILASATHPGRCAALVTITGFARTRWAPDYEWAPTDEAREANRARMFATWGQGLRARGFMPSSARQAAYLEWFAALERLSAGPGDARRLFALLDAVDVRDVLPSVRVPTLVLHPREPSFIDVRHAEYLAERIPGARLALYPGSDAVPIRREAREAVAGEIEELVTGARRAARVDRALATILFTDIVGSTARAAELGDDGWRLLLERHERLVRDGLSRWGGRFVKSLGDGFLATFDGPTSAVRCAMELAQTSGELPIRAGLHTGEIERAGGDVRGLAVHIGARVASLAGAGEVLLSQTVKDLTVGSALRLEDRGAHELKGVPGTWRVHLARSDASG